MTAITSPFYTAVAQGALLIYNINVWGRTSDLDGDVSYSKIITWRFSCFLLVLRFRVISGRFSNFIVLEAGYIWVLFPCTSVKYSSYALDLQRRL